MNLIFDFSSNVTNGVVSKAGKITGTISLGIYGTGTSSNPNIRTTVTVYFLDGSDPTTVKFRLETLISECEKLTKDSYTSTSWTVFSNQLSTAKAILSYSNTDSDMLQNAYDSLTEAKKNLVSGSKRQHQEDTFRPPHHRQDLQRRRNIHR